MGWFSYKCSEHGEFKVSLPKRETSVPCSKCQSKSYPALKAGTISVMERLDNGAMGRAVERLHDIEEIMNKRADDHTAATTEPDEE